MTGAFTSSTPTAPSRRGETDRLAAEVVVALDDRVRRDAARQRCDRAGASQAQVRRAERRRHRDPAHAATGAARRLPASRARSPRARGRPVLPPPRPRAPIRPSCRARSDRWRSRGSSSGGRTSRNESPACARAARRTGRTRRGRRGADPVSSPRSARGAPRGWPGSARCAACLCARAIFSASSSDRRSALGRTVAPHRSRTVSTLRTVSTFGAIGEPLLGQPHEDVLDEAADQRRVVADPLDAEAGVGRHAPQLGNVGERIE